MTNAIVNELKKHIESFEFHLGAEKAYHYFWHTFADKIIEESKTRLNQNNDTDDRISVQYTLLTILKTSLRLLHPFMPFITEEIWSIVPKMPSEGNLLIIESWPH